MASSPPSPPPLVWVTQGKNQHAAYLLEIREEENQCLIRWSSNNETAVVDQQKVARALTPRRRSRPIMDESSSSEDENDENQSMIEDEVNSPPRKGGKRRAPPQVACRENDDDSSDDEIEVLLTIMPPTPKRSKQKASNESDMNEARRVSTSPQPNDEVQNASCKHDEEPPSNSPDEKRTQAAVPEQAVPDIDDSVVQSAVSSTSVSHQTSAAPEPTYTFQSSAYVQNLAEICHTILNDARWRVEERAQKPLVAWEQGEDLSAVRMLSKLFNPTPVKKRVSQCRCLLCREEEAGEGSRKQNVEEDNHGDGSSTMERNSGDDTSSLENTLQPECEVDEETARALYLYSRLYYRKGPWFRLDNIFKYYAPEDPSSPENDDTDELDTEEEERNTNIILKERRNSFFDRSSSSLSTNDQSNKGDKKKSEMIDEAALQDRISEVALMLRDVERLHAMGLVRSFRDEKECGMTVGAVSPEGTGILTAKERQSIVDQLGGRNKKEKSRKDARENIVWKQMRTQKRISFNLPSNDEETEALLPVRCHVDDALLEKLATRIVLASSTVDYLPAAIRRPAVADVKARILQLSLIGPRCISMCITLREAPLLTLRRCTRLYLCATSGPGDMRGDDTNAWRSLSDFNVASIHPDMPLPTVVQPPGSHSWHRVLHPSLSYRFGIASFAFIGSHEFLSVDEATGSDHTLQQAQVFETVDTFRMWELCVEIRANVDYHLELSETQAYMARRRAREEECDDDDPSNSEQDGPSDEASPHVSLVSDCDVAVDLLGLLTENGRKSLVCKLVAFTGADPLARDVDDICESIEHTLSKLKTTKGGKSSEGELFANDSEKIVVVFSVIIVHILVMRNQLIAQEEILLKQSRPWLRHLFWEGVLSYALWDCIPLLERKGLYELACSCLEVVLFGSTQNRDSILVHDSRIDGRPLFGTTPLPELLMSRRARGKAYERLMIDYKHILQWQAKVERASLSAEELNEESVVSRGKESKKTAEKIGSPQDALQGVCRRILESLTRAGSIPFSAVRGLARRIKAPLSTSLKGLSCPEVETLGIRLGNERRDGVPPTIGNAKTEKLEGYIDWIPPTDFAVANAMVGEGEETLVGKRCSYVGFEDGDEKADLSSFNVEELAMQYYATGRLPTIDTADDDLFSGGGWFGWHDEGGHVRALFRIICANPILGMDSGCHKESRSQLESLEQLTIHLTPYQGAPFDLHVAHRESVSSRGSENGPDGSQDVGLRSFYERRRVQIDRFLRKLEDLSNQELSDLVYDSIVCRLAGQGRIQDNLLARDLQQIRTLSMLAVGFGGRQIAAIFRSLVFDYRHYSGGLPDLLLVRARTVNDTDEEAGRTNGTALIDLGDWIGEEFSTEARMEKEITMRSGVLIDKDDEFLGCSKVGDSRGQSSGGRWKQKRGAQRKQSSDEGTTDEKPPPRLILRHKDKDVDVQCLFVEVKSQNDRLDGRQEDWLNILDNVGGNARVCKFGSGKKKKKSTKKVTMKSTK